MYTKDMLDDANVIAQRDPQGALGYIAQQPAQLTHDFGVAGEQRSRPGKIVFAGMGGSVLVADFARVAPVIPVPFVVVKSYHLPTWVDNSTLVICGSYSGNTEETLAALDEAEAKGAQIAIITHGGTLLERAKAAGYLLVELPECPQPRTSVFYAFRGLAEILITHQVVDSSFLSELQRLVEPLSMACERWRSTIPEVENHAKQLAQHMLGKTLIVYGGDITSPAAWKWKISANENAKNTAWTGVYPEFNHNEFIGWSSHPIDKPFCVVDLISSYDHQRIQKRFTVSDRLLSGLRPKAIQLQAEGESALEHLLYFVLLGDFATTYLAILNGVNPTPVDLVEKFKKVLNE